jgi:hypothetical protein
MVLLAAAGSATTDWITAISTLVLAVFTIGLVVVTAFTVRHAQRTYNAERLDAIEDRETQLTTIGAQILAQYRPTLIEVQPSGPVYPEMGAKVAPNGEQLLDFQLGTFQAKVDPRVAYVELTPTGIIISFAVRNVGFGLAIIDPEKVRFFGPEIAAFALPEVHRPRVPVGETARLDFHAQFKSPGVTPQLEVWVFYVEYTDYRGLQPTVAGFGLQQDPIGQWYVAGAFQVETTLEEFLDTAKDKRDD